MQEYKVQLDSIDKIGNFSFKEKEYRSKNLTHFNKLGFPNKRSEDWKFSDLRDIMSKNFKKLELNPLNIVNNNMNNKSYNEDCNYLIKRIEGDILYLDPPYNSRQYLPNYHLLETIAKYDDPKIKGKTGIREYENQKSNFCNKSYAEDALESLIKNSNFRYILLSYNSEGIISERKLEKLLKSYSNKLFKKYRFDYRRYKKDKKTNKDKLYELIHVIDKN